MHICYTSDGAEIVCLCIRGVDHDESEFDVPLDETASGREDTHE